MTSVGEIAPWRYYLIQLTLLKWYNIHVLYQYNPVYRRVGEMFVSMHSTDWSAISRSLQLGLSQPASEVYTVQYTCRGFSNRYYKQVAYQKGLHNRPIV